MSLLKQPRWESEPWRRAVASLPCVRCFREGNTQAAHRNQSKGMGLKTDDCWTAALCVSAVPDIGDKAAREATIARMAYSAGMAAERERCANECRRLYFTRGCIANGLDCEAAIRGA